MLMEPTGRLSTAFRVLAGIVALSCVPAGLVGTYLVVDGFRFHSTEGLVLGGLLAVGGSAGALGFGAAAITGQNMDWPASIRALRDR